jgi:hypothetical protein
MQDTEYAEEFDTGTPYSEIEEMEYAAKLLEITDEEELNGYLAGLMNKGSRTVGAVLKPSMGRALGGYLKGAISQVLPGLGAAAATYLAPDASAGPERGRANSAGQMLGLELEGLSTEDDGWWA